MKNDFTRCVVKLHLFSLLGVLIFLCTGNALADSPIVVDAAGHTVGYFVSQSGICNDATTIPVYSFDGYLACFLTTGKADFYLQPPGTFGPWQAGYFNAPGCASPYGKYEYALQVAGPTHGGYVVSTSEGLMYSSVDAPLLNLPIVSMWVGSPESGFCETVSPPLQTPMVPLFGVDQTFGYLFNRSPYRPPFSVQMLPNTSLMDVVFFDSMDVEYP